ncbi:MAG: hypothetical protein V4496_07805 [Pseudomonadota bacterium]
MVYFVKATLATEAVPIDNDMPTAVGTPITVNELINEGLPSTNGIPAPAAAPAEAGFTPFRSWYARGLALDAENLKEDGIIGCAHAICYVLPADLHNTDTRKQFQNAILLLERWLQNRKTFSGQLLKLFPPYSNSKQFVIESLAKWYGHEYRFPTASNDRATGNYAPHISNVTIDEVAKNTHEQMLHAHWRTLRGTNAQKVEAIIDYKNRLLAPNPR